jgi:hypothetical protein
LPQHREGAAGKLGTEATCRPFGWRGATPDATKSSSSRLLPRPRRLVPDLPPPTRGLTLGAPTRPACVGAWPRTPSRPLQRFGGRRNGWPTGQVARAYSGTSGGQWVSWSRPGLPPGPARDLCTRHGIILIFDEVMTGFRLARGGPGAVRRHARPDYAGQNHRGRHAPWRLWRPPGHHGQVAG